MQKTFLWRITVWLRKDIFISTSLVNHLISLNTYFDRFLSSLDDSDLDRELKSRFRFLR